MVDMSGIMGNQLSQIMKDTYETIWSINVQDIKIIKKSQVQAGNMFYADLNKGETEFTITANVYSPDYSKVGRNMDLNTVEYKYHVYTQPTSYPDTNFIIENNDQILYNGKRYEINNLNSQTVINPGQPLLQKDILWQEFDLQLIE